MAAETITWYRSKIDWWVGLLLCVPPVVSIGVCIALALDGKSSELLIGIAPILLVFGIYIGLLFPMKYGMDDTHLHLRFGLMRPRIPLSDISEVYPTRNPLSSPALSLDRLYVTFGTGFSEAVMISPADRDRFLDELARKAGLKREGDRLVRA